jgi:hypothetical protein
MDWATTDLPTEPPASRALDGRPTRDRIELRKLSDDTCRYGLCADRDSEKLSQLLDCRSGDCDPDYDHLASDAPSFATPGSFPADRFP